MKLQIRLVECYIFSTAYREVDTHTIFHTHEKTGDLGNSFTDACSKSIE